MDLFFAFPTSEHLLAPLVAATGGEVLDIGMRTFPDGEWLVRLPPEVKGRRLVIVSSLDHPDDKFLPLHFMACTARELGARRVTLVAPYLPYFRQDTRFEPGQAVSARLFAHLLGGTVDELITIDPHLHRFRTLGEVFPIPARAVSAAQPIAAWIGRQVDTPLLIGPDIESRQWVAEVAGQCRAPHLVARKRRRGDREVEVIIPDTRQYLNHTPVLLDDILSTGRTMITTARLLLQQGLAAPVCIAVHGLFAGDAYAELLAAGVADIVTTNTIRHPSNEIDITPVLADALSQESA